MDDKTGNLYKKLTSKGLKKSIPFHMPGHKRNVGFAPYLKNIGAKYDITEIPGFDNLHNPQDILLETMNKAQALWSTKKTFLLVNGSTVGILAGIYSMTKRGDKVIVARNCHKSVYNALELFGLNPVFIKPGYFDATGLTASISPKTVADAIEKNPDTKLVIVTSPTYDGVISDIKSICETAHDANIPVFVDEAHGAHLDLCENFSNGSVKAGADMVVHSLHKTLPSLTQTALLHINGERTDEKAVMNALSIFETSSPSYILLSSISECINLLYLRKEQLFSNWIGNVEYMKQSLLSLENMSIVSDIEMNDNDRKIYAYDNSKLIITIKNNAISGKRLFDMLVNEYFVIPEMYTGSYVLFMLSMCDKRKNIKKLCTALKKIDKTIVSKHDMSDSYVPLDFSLPRRVMPPDVATQSNRNNVNIFDAKGKISASYVWAFPPQIPLLIPGEAIDKQFIDFYEHNLTCGITFEGITSDMIAVVFEDSDI